MPSCQDLACPSPGIGWSAVPGACPGCDRGGSGGDWFGV